MHKYWKYLHYSNRRLKNTNAERKESANGARNLKLQNPVSVTTTDPLTFEIALVRRPVIFLHMAAASAVDVGASSLMTVFKPA